VDVRHDSVDGCAGRTRKHRFGCTVGTGHLGPVVGGLAVGWIVPAGTSILSCLICRHIVWLSVGGQEADPFDVLGLRLLKLANTEKCRPF